MKRSVVVLGGFALWVACAGAAGCGSRGDIPAYTKDQGDAICKDFSTELQLVSSKWALVSWLAGIVGTACAVSGGIVGTGKDGDKLRRRVAGVLLASLGSVLAATSAYAVSRSSAASDAASASTTARRKAQDYDRFLDCLDARAAWLQSRAASLDQTPPPSPDKSRQPQSASGGHSP
ncbi:MAG: hypothetical protein ABUS79_02260 [Pseudomonadota bacterium]